MVNPTISFGGLASGLDTNSIIDQLVALERQPIRRYELQQRELRDKDNAWGKVVSKLSGIRSALDDVRRSGSLEQKMSGSSSNEAAVTVSSTGGGSPDSLSFRVSALASRHREGFDGEYSDPTSTVGAGSFEILDSTGASVGTVTTDASTTLQGLADAVDGLGVGVNATVLKVGEGNYQLVMSSEETGADAQFSISTDLTSLETGSTLATGANAKMTMGSLVIERSSNTISDLIEGTTITLNEVTTEDVTIDLSRDTEGAGDAVEALVTAMNEMISTLDSLTAYDAETGRSGPLQGESLARNLAANLRAALTDQVSTTGDYRYSGDIGISLTRDGKVELDRAELTAALEDDPDAVFSLLSETLGGSSGVDLTFAGDAAAAGSFSMTVSQAATVAAVTGANYVPPANDPEIFTVTTSDGTEVSVTIDADMTQSMAVARINAALEAAEVTSIRASEEGGALRIASLGYGSGQTFTVAGSAQGLDGTYTGTDVVADFGNGAVTGSGRSVTGDGAAEGLTMTVTGGVDTYSLSFGRGLGGLIDDYMSSLEGTDGLVQTARDSIDTSLGRFDDQIAALERRAESRELTLRRQFSGLESTLGRLQSQGSFLASQLAGLNGGGGGGGG